MDFLQLVQSLIKKIVYNGFYEGLVNQVSYLNYINYSFIILLTKHKILGTHEVSNLNYADLEDHLKVVFSNGWALKSNQQKFKESIDDLVKIRLEAMYLAGVKNSSERYTYITMHKELLQAVDNGEIDEENIPEMITIKNWIQNYHVKYMKNLQN